MQSRSRSVLAKLVTLLALPLISLVVLWAIAASITLSDGLTLLAASSRSDEIGFPGANLLGALQVERKISVTDVGAGRRNSVELTAARKKTDEAYSAFRKSTSDSSHADEIRPELDALLAAADELPQQRSWIDTGASPRLTVSDYYSDLIAKIFGTSYALGATPEPGRGHRSEGLLQIGEAAEIFSQEAAIVSGALAAGAFQTAEYDRTISLINTRRYLLTNALQKFPAVDQQELIALGDTSTGRMLADMEDSIVRDGSRNRRPPVDENNWNEADAGMTKAYANFSRQAAVRFIDELKPGGYRTIALLVIAGLLGLIAVVVSIFVSIRIGRSLVRELVGVQRSAQSLATYELPAVVRRLRAGESVDVDAEVQPMTGFTIREIEGVASAMDAARSTAVEVAIEEAQLRRGVREVFLNLARRSQALIHRQLTLLDAMERKEKNPDELEDLFTLDHLATRMRRHAEDLIVLSGSTPGRGWRNPVPLIDVMRGAIAEVEDYARVRVVGAPRASLAGRGVSDVIHLLAELIENATSFSPPHTTVHVTGELVPAGFAIEIEDRGLGMPADQVEAVNQRLSEPPEFDLLQSERLGLFVVGQLARRHDIRVVLRGSPFGGTTAIVLLPGSMIVAPEGAIPQQRREPPLRAEAMRGEPLDAELDVAGPPVLTVAPGYEELAPGGGAHRAPEQGEEVLNGTLSTDPPPVFDSTAWSGGSDWSLLSTPLDDTVLRPADERRAPSEPSAASEPSSASEPSEASADGLPPLIRRDPGADWENLSSQGPLPRRERRRPDPSDADDLGREGGDVRPRGVARAPLASRGLPDDEPATEPESLSLGDRLRSRLDEDAAAETAAEAAAETAAAPEPAATTTGGLPRRVRQASLAAPLRAGSGIPSAPIEPTTMRSPEEIRAVMGSYQRGSVLGRSDAARTIGPDSPADDGPESGAEGSTSEPDGVPAGQGSNTGALEGER
ncbi:nitrate- and nitrite sensing domain-containing protein [Cryptosporangium sp. NPDC048952]|uniref:sensor histidine kinase n=1 Tax=Cryptosporangium sp. NPDC048952 TaxID=3363961 RepID=UPI003716D645